jgi:hypothetical protein
VAISERPGAPFSGLEVGRSVVWVLDLGLEGEGEMVGEGGAEMS